MHKHSDDELVSYPSDHSEWGSASEDRYSPTSNAGRHHENLKEDDPQFSGSTGRRKLPAGSQSSTAGNSSGKKHRPAKSTEKPTHKEHHGRVSLPLPKYCLFMYSSRGYTLRIHLDIYANTMTETPQWIIEP